MLSFGHIINPLLTKHEVKWLGIGFVLFFLRFGQYPAILTSGLVSSEQGRIANQSLNVENAFCESAKLREHALRIDQGADKFQECILISETATTKSPVGNKETLSENRAIDHLECSRSISNPKSTNNFAMPIHVMPSSEQRRIANQSLNVENAFCESAKLREHALRIDQGADKFKECSLISETVTTKSPVGNKETISENRAIDHLECSRSISDPESTNNFAMPIHFMPSSEQGRIANQSLNVENAFCESAKLREHALRIDQGVDNFKECSLISETVTTKSPVGNEETISENRVIDHLACSRSISNPKSTNNFAMQIHFMPSSEERRIANQGLNVKNAFCEASKLTEHALLRIDEETDTTKGPVGNEEAISLGSRTIDKIGLSSCPTEEINCSADKAVLDVTTSSDATKKQKPASLSEVEMTGELRSAIRKVREFYSGEINFQRDGDRMQQSTIGKLVERICRFLWFVKHVKHSEPDLSYCGNAEMVQEFVNFMINQRHVKAITCSRYCTAFINVLKFLNSEKSSAECFESMESLRCLQRQLERTSKREKKTVSVLNPRPAEKIVYAELLELCREFKVGSLPKPQVWHKRDIA